MKLGILLFALLFTTACANRPCREPQSPDAKKALATAAENAATVRVAKSDKSKQCGTLGVSIESMEKELKGIKILSKEKKSDGLMRIQMCGADTGLFNIYEINKSDLEKAKSFGFQEWTKE